MPKCKSCGRSFKLENAIKKFNDRFENDFEYQTEYNLRWAPDYEGLYNETDGLCGICAIAKVEYEIESGNFLRNHPDYEAEVISEDESDEKDMSGEWPGTFAGLPDQLLEDMFD